MLRAVVGVGMRQPVLQQLPASQQRQFPQVGALEVRQVEEHVGDVLGAGAVEGCLQCMEIPTPCRIPGTGPTPA